MERFRRGASAVEFALSLPWVLLALVGSVDFAMWLLSHQTVSRAVQDGARVASVILLEDGSSDGAPIEEGAEQATLDALVMQGHNQSSVDATWAADANGLMWLTVSAAVTYNPLLGDYSPFPRVIRRNFVVMTQEQINN